MCGLPELCFSRTVLLSDADERPLCLADFEFTEMLLIRSLNRHCVALLAILLTLSLTGCCSFERDWRQSLNYAYPEHELAGCWEGTWQSDWNQHHGGLRAIITKESESTYRAKFKATYLVVVPFEFEMPLLVAEDGQIYTFEGEADLGLLAGGLYTYKGSAAASEFASSYCGGNGDHGTFTMTKRPTCSQELETGDCAPKRCAR